MGTLVCKIKCFHGKLWEPGAKSTKEQLFKLNPLPHPDDVDSTELFDNYIEKFWTGEGSPEAEEAEAYNEAENLKNFLTAHKVKFHPRWGIANLRKKVAEFKASAGKAAKKDPLK
jgi:hypothetical protein